MNTTNRPDTITVTWDAANSPYCGEVLYYVVMISSDEHCNIMNDIVNVTDLSLLTATFTNLKNDTNYDVTVITAYSRLVDGGTTTVNIKTSSPVPTQSNNTPGMYVFHMYVAMHTHKLIVNHLGCNKVTKGVTTIGAIKATASVKDIETLK